MEKTKQIVFGTVVVFYITSIIGYFLGKSIAGNVGLEYRFWVETLIRIIVWFVPTLLMAGLLILVCRNQWKKKRGNRWRMLIILILYCLAASFLSFWYVIFHAVTMTTDKKMNDGNLVVAVPAGMEYYHHYAEPVGFIFRRNITFDDERVADSLSEIYDVSFQIQKADNGDTVFVSDVYPGVEVKVIRHGYIESTYLDNNLKFALTSQRMEEHRDIFNTNEVELVPYVFGRTEDNPRGYGTYYAVLITDENQEEAATAIAQFIQTTLREDKRPDGESCWSSVDGSILLAIEDKETGQYEGFRNISFSLKPEYFWIFDETVTAREIFEEIAKTLD